MKRLYSKISCALLIISSLFILNGCNDSYSDGERHSLPETSAKLDELQKKYGVTISQDKNAGLTDEEFDIVEKEIIALKEVFKPARYRKVELQSLPLLKGRSENAESTEWAFNLSWLTISANISEDDTEFTLESWLTGVTVYSYEQKGLSHNYTPRTGQKVVEYKFTMVCTIEILDKVGLRITADQEVEGEVDFSDGTISSEW